MECEMKTLLSKLSVTLQSKLESYKVVLGDVKKENEKSVDVLRKRVIEKAEQWIEKIKSEQKIDAQIVVSVRYEGLPQFDIVYYDERGNERTHNITFSTSFRENEIIDKCGWFSTSEKPSSTNKLVEYLKLVACFNEAILNRDSMILYFDKRNKDIKEYMSEISSLEYKVKAIEKDIKFINDYTSVFGESNFNKALIEKTQVTDLKNTANLFGMRYVSKAGFFNEVMGKINTMLTQYSVNEEQENNNQ